MKKNRAFDSHKRYTLAFAEDEKHGMIDESRIEHERGAEGERVGPERGSEKPL